MMSALVMWVPHSPNRGFLVWKRVKRISLSMVWGPVGGGGNPCPSPVKIFCDHTVITNHARDHGCDHSFYRDHGYEKA